MVISGRCFRAADTKGPWEFVPADKLPADFAKIPDDSTKENVKASVAGTPQAEEAAISANIPQTAAVKRNEVKMTPPHFDGEPQTRPIEGTPLQYVFNTAAPIIMVDAQSWYAVENGVWFVATSVKGPWTIATSVPAVIYSIPPTSPVHYVTYVKVNDATPDTVIVSYTPGYQGTCVDPVTNVVVYGTGYPYTPWIGSVWYGPPIYHSPYYWGGAAYGYRGGAVAWGPGGWAGTTGNIYSQWGNRATVSRYSGGYNAWTGNAWSRRVGTSYNSRTGVATAGQRGAVQNVYTGNYATGGRGVATGPGGGAAVGRGGTAGNVYTGREVSAGQAAVYNPRTGQTTTMGGIKGEQGGAVRVGDDVYAGHDGNVYKKTDSGWQQHGSGGWSNVDRPSAGSLDRDYSSRVSGSQRYQNYQSSSRSMNRSYGGGMRRGGGGRRR